MCRKFKTCPIEKIRRQGGSSDPYFVGVHEMNTYWSSGILSQKEDLGFEKNKVSGGERIILTYSRLPEKEEEERREI